MPNDVKTVSRYEQDFNAWALEQAESLRAVRHCVTQEGSVTPAVVELLRVLDWDNLAEEIEGLARRDRRELGSRIAPIIEHLVKLQHSPARDPRPGWIETVGREREEVREILRDSPSLRGEVPDLIARRATDAVDRATRDLVDRAEINQTTAAKVSRDDTEEQVLGDWWPAPRAAARRRRSNAES